MNKQKMLRKVVGSFIATALVLGTPTIIGSTTLFPKLVVTAEAASSSLAAPKGIKISMSRGTMTVSWNKVNGASTYKVEVKYPGQKYKTFKTVSKTKTKIPYLKNRDKVSVRITAMKKNSSGGYTKGKSSSITKTFKCEKLYLDDNSVFGIDTALLGMTLSQLEDALDQELELYDSVWDNLYWTFPMFDSSHAAAVLFDKKSKKVVSIYTDRPLDEWDGNMMTDLNLTYGDNTELDSENDFWFIYDVNSKVLFEVFQETYADDSGDMVVRQQFWLKDYTV